MNQELIEIIKNSQLSQEEKKEWENMVLVMPEEAIQVILETIKEGVQDIASMNEFYQRKKKAFSVYKENKEEGQKMLDSIYKEEAELLKNLED